MSSLRLSKEMYPAPIVQIRLPPDLIIKICREILFARSCNSRFLQSCVLVHVPFEENVVDDTYLRKKRISSRS